MYVGNFDFSRNSVYNTCIVTLEYDLEIFIQFVNVNVETRFNCILRLKDFLSVITWETHKKHLRLSDLTSLKAFVIAFPTRVSKNILLFYLCDCCPRFAQSSKFTLAK